MAKFTRHWEALLLSWFVLSDEPNEKPLLTSIEFKHQKENKKKVERRKTVSNCSTSFPLESRFPILEKLFPPLLFLRSSSS